MRNFAPPYKLKQFIDLVAQRRYLFSYDGKQYGPMLNVAKAVAVYMLGSRFLGGFCNPGLPLRPSRSVYRLLVGAHWSSGSERRCCR
jgi:FMN-dependent NADH-azoreductase